MRQARFRDGKPHNLRRPPNQPAYAEAWFYNDARGITLVARAPGLIRIPWSQIRAAMKREGVRPALRRRGASE